MYDEQITITGKRENIDLNSTLECVVFVDMTGDAFSSDANNTEREDIVVSIHPSCFGYVQKIKRGDSIFRPQNNKRYKVSEIKNDVAMGWIIRAREV